MLNRSPLVGLLPLCLVIVIVACASEDPGSSGEPGSGGTSVGGQPGSGGSGQAGSGGSGQAGSGGSGQAGSGGSGQAGSGGGFPAANLFFDGFESGDMSATNANGFKWAGNNRTSVVTKDAAVWNNGAINNPKPSGADWTPLNGNHSLRFRYPANESWSEQRFDLGKPELELWMRWWVRVPFNYVHGPIGTPARNQKFLSVWMDGYSAQGDGSSVWLGFHPSGDGTDSTLAYTYSKGGKTASVAYAQSKPFIDSSADKGRWMQVVFHIKAESADGADDGIIETWRRWQDETTFTKFHEDLAVGLRVPPAGPQGFKFGYLMGWANGNYAEDTDFLLDDFELSTAPLL